MNDTVTMTGGTITVFGLALSAAALPTQVDAAVVALTPTGSVSTGVIDTINLSGGGFSFGISMWNDGVGQTVFAPAGGGIVAASAGAVISSGASFVSGGITRPPNQGTTEFFGFTLATGELGWFQVSFGNSSPSTILSAAIETDAGASITVPSPVPVPASLALLGSALALAGGASAIRRRRRLSEAA